MIDDIITLIDESVTGYDAYGNEIKGGGFQYLTNEAGLILATESGDLIGFGDDAARELFCRVSTVGRNEFYQAATAGLHPELVVRLSDYMDYQGEKTAEYNGTRYSIIRTYRGGGNLSLNEIELILERKIGNE